MEDEMLARKPQDLWRYMAWTFILSWLFWIPLILFSLPSWLLTPMILIGAFMPSIVGTIMSLRTQDKEGRKEFRDRLFNPRRIGIKMLPVVIFLFPVVYVAALAIGRAAHVPVPGMDIMMQTISHPISLAIFLIVMLLGGPLAEEIGWRGFALDYLQDRFRPLKSSLILGFFWAFWHAPLFFIEGTSQYAWGFFSLSCLNWTVQVFLLTIIMTWVYNSTSRSIMAAIGLHLMINLPQTLVAGVGNELLSIEVDAIRTAILAVVSLMIGLGSHQFSRKRVQ
jgi:membrane protease YdiL (CAAX protease family)